MGEGRHVLGHAVLESWQALAKAGNDTTVMGTPKVIRQAVRDIKLLAELLDADVGMMSDMVNAYGVNVDRSADIPVGVAPRGASVDEQPAFSGKGITITWPAKEFKNLGELARWVQAQEMAIPMSAILRESGKPTAAKITITEAKAAVERILVAWAKEA